MDSNYRWLNMALMQRRKHGETASQRYGANGIGRLPLLAGMEYRRRVSATRTANVVAYNISVYGMLPSPEICHILA